jgi:hypothetical protein
MDTELEQVTHCLDQALIAFSAGQSDDGCRHLQQASAILDTIAVPAADTMVAAAVDQSTRVEQERIAELVPAEALALVAAA